jgi:hypothetical protein
LLILQVQHQCPFHSHPGVHAWLRPSDCCCIPLLTTILLLVLRASLDFLKSYLSFRTYSRRDSRPGATGPFHRSTLPLFLSSFIISDSVRFSESGGCGASSAPLPHRPVSIPSLSHSASPLRKPSKSALSARTRFRGHSHGPLPDVPGPSNRLSSRHSHFIGSQTAFRSMRPSA